MTGSLHGALVLVTRPATQAETLCRLIQQQGGRVLRFPTLEIQPVAVCHTDLEQVADCDWLIFTSANAVEFALKAFDGKMPDWQKTRLAAVGKATALKLQQAGLAVSCVPANDFSSEGLLAEPALQHVERQRILVVRGIGGRETLATSLRQRGALVGYLEVYRRSRPQADPAALAASLQQGLLSAATATSGEALHNLLAMLDSHAADLLRELPLVVASDRIRELAAQLGFKRAFACRQPTDSAILKTLTTLLNGENSGRSN